MLLTLAQIKPKSFKLIETKLCPVRTRLMFTCVLGRYVDSTVLLVSKIINTKMGHPGSLLYKKRGSSGSQHSKRNS